MLLLMAAGMVEAGDMDERDRNTAGPASDTGSRQPDRVGQDRDAHGCISSAGYRWCEKTGRCERPWELARAEGFENSLEAFERYCKNKGTGEESE